MGLFQRINDIITANLNEMTASFEDPEKMLTIIAEINRLLSEKEQRLQNLRLQPDGHSGFRAPLKESQEDSPTHD